MVSSLSDLPPLPGPPPPDDFDGKDDGSPDDGKGEDNTPENRNQNQDWLHDAVFPVLVFGPWHDACRHPDPAMTDTLHKPGTEGNCPLCIISHKGCQIYFLEARRPPNLLLCALALWAFYLSHGTSPSQTDPLSDGVTRFSRIHLAVNSAWPLPLRAGIRTAAIRH